MWGLNLVGLEGLIDWGLTLVSLEGLIDWGLALVSLEGLIDWGLWISARLLDRSSLSQYYIFSSNDIITLTIHEIP